MEPIRLSSVMTRGRSREQHHPAVLDWRVVAARFTTCRINVDWQIQYALGMILQTTITLMQFMHLIGCSSLWRT